MTGSTNVTQTGGVIKRFLKFIEIKTKITSVLTFLLILAYLFWLGEGVNPLETTIFFASMLLFDMTATAINNYSDTKKNGIPLQFKRSVARVIIGVLFAISTALGIWLYTLTDLVVLLLGALCFLFGVLYSFGPLPISHTPLGEVVSGFFYGFVIPLIMLYINLPNGFLLSLGITKEQVDVVIRLVPFLSLVLISVVPFALTAGIMLANNICDLERDKAVGRFTLPYYIGTDISVKIFVLICAAPYLAVLLAVILGVLPVVDLLIFLTLPLVWKSTATFVKRQDKEDTFNVSVKNFIVIILTLAILTAVGAVLKAVI